MPIIIIPISDISSEALKGLLEEYVSRDGTDYGAVEASIDEKIEDLRKQLDSGELKILFNEETREFDIAMREQMKNFSVNS